MSNFFEGWYFKHQKGQEMLAVIPGRAADGAFIQVISQEGTFRAEYPLSAYHHKGTELQVAQSRFSKNGIYLCIDHGDIQLTGELNYDRLTPIRGDIMGPFRYLPMQCRHTVVSMRHTLEGSVCLNGKPMDFTAGMGYIEGDSGRSFPKSYTWVQCNDFTQNCAIMASVAHIPFGPASFWGCICVVWLGGKEYRLATYRGAKIKCRDARELWLEQGDLSLRVRFLGPQGGHPLGAPIQGKMRRIIHETPAAPVYFEFRDGDRVLFEEKSDFASYEHME